MGAARVVPAPRPPHRQAQVEVPEVQRWKIAVTEVGCRLAPPRCSRDGASPLSTLRVDTAERALVRDRRHRATSSARGSLRRAARRCHRTRSRRRERARSARPPQRGLAASTALRAAPFFGFDRLPSGLSLGLDAPVIGFTVALFIAELAFTDERQVTDAKMAILLASVLSGVVSFAVLRGARANHA